MKAIQFTKFGAAHVLKLVDIPTPLPQRDELLIEVTASGVNYVDVRERQGVYQRADTKVGGATLPRTPGLQASGIVTEVGPKGDRGLIGKSVVALLPGGGYAQFAIAPSATTVCVPSTADHVTMAHTRHNGSQPI